MIEFLKKRWPLILVVLVFVVLKVPHLRYAFFWDECWPYASAVNKMYQNGPSLLPGSIDGDLARGHPLMFHFLASLWMKVFGTSNIAMHSFPLFIAVLTLIILYEAGLWVEGMRTAVAAVILVASQQMFFVESSFLLMEIMQALLGFAAILFYAQRRYVLLAISLATLYYTKESGLVVGVVLGIDTLILLFKKHESRQHKLKLVVAQGFPVVAIGVFFLLQKKINGWYVLPLYAKGLESDIRLFYARFSDFMGIYFKNDLLKCLWYFITLLLLVLAYIKKKKAYVYPALLIPIAALIVNGKYDFVLLGYMQMALIVPGLLILPGKLFKNIISLDAQRLHFIRLLMAAIVAFTIFMSFNLFFIYRYALMSFVPMLFIAVVIGVGLIKELNGKLYPVLMLVIIGVNACAYRDRTGLYDMRMGAYDAMYVQQRVADFMEAHEWTDKNISIYDGLQNVRLTDVNAGFLKKGKPFRNILWGVKANTDIILLDNLEGKERTTDSSKVIKMKPDFKLIFRAERGQAWSEVYERMK